MVSSSSSSRAMIRNSDSKTTEKLDGKTNLKYWIIKMNETGSVQ